MTLLYTEISQDLPGHGRCVLFAADRRITTSAGGPPRHYKKLVDIPYLNAALGFFGLAEFRRNQTIFRMADHLREFVRAQAGIASLSLFAERLATSLNWFVPSSLRRSKRSGIHISGMTAGSLPEFWFVRNVDAMESQHLVSTRPRNSTSAAMLETMVLTARIRPPFRRTAGYIVMGISLRTRWLGKLLMRPLALYGVSLSSRDTIAK